MTDVHFREPDGINSTPVSATNPLPVTAIVGGMAAAGTVAAGQPVPIGGDFNNTPPTYTSGQRGTVQIGSRGALHVHIMDQNSTAAAACAQLLNESASYSAGGIVANARLLLWDGADGDRARTIGGMVAGGNAVGVAAVEAAGALFNNITSATTTIVKSGAGILHKLLINTKAAGATVTIYDNTAASGTKIGTITMPGTLLSDGPVEINYATYFGTGLTVVTIGTQDITIVYR